MNRGINKLFETEAYFTDPSPNSENKDMVFNADLTAYAIKSQLVKNFFPLGFSWLVAVNATSRMQTDSG